MKPLKLDDASVKNMSKALWEVMAPALKSLEDRLSALEEVVEELRNPVPVERDSVSPHQLWAIQEKMRRYSEEMRTYRDNVQKMQKDAETKAWVDPTRAYLGRKVGPGSW